MKTSIPVDWDKLGEFVPAIIQDNDTLQVLMLGYMNAEALSQTTETGRVTFYSRSKKRLWINGETSGHYLAVVSITPNCDRDAVLIRARPNGPTCHRGTCGCFGEDGAFGVGFLAQLERTINQRIAANDESSYTVKLMRAGVKRVAQKVGEEGVETALAATTGDAAELGSEAADLIFHLLVLLRTKGLNLSYPLAILEQRHQVQPKPRN
jgi:phosphoribosyl-AMP cyclohydrolase / phosphoribosyl-ATP pyrophosphohydrolase